MPHAGGNAIVVGHADDLFSALRRARAILDSYIKTISTRDEPNAVFIHSISSIHLEGDVTIK